MAFHRIDALTPCSIPGCSNRLHHGSWAYIEEKGTDHVAKGKVFCVEHATGLSPEDAALCNADRLSAAQKTRVKTLEACEPWRKANSALWLKLTSRKTTDAPKEAPKAPEKPKSQPPKAKAAPKKVAKKAPKKTAKKRTTKKAKTK